MIQRAVVAIFGVALGLFVTFAVFSSILGGLDAVFLMTQDACDYVVGDKMRRAVRVARENLDHPGDANAIDWSAEGMDLIHDGYGGCEVDAFYNARETHLSPTGDRVMDGLTYKGQEASLGAWTIDDGEVADLAGADDGNAVGVWSDGVRLYILSDTSGTGDVIRVSVYRPPMLKSHFLLDEVTWPSTDNPKGGLVARGPYFWVAYGDQGELRALYRDGGSYGPVIALASANDAPEDLAIRDNIIYVMQGTTAYAYDVDRLSYVPAENLTLATGVASGIWIDTRDRLHLFDGVNHTLYIYADYRDSVNSESGTVVSSATDMYDGAAVYTMTYDRTVYSVNLGEAGIVNEFYVEGPALVQSPLHGFRWMDADGVFAAQQRLVSLLAVVGAIGMPVGAMTAIVFFGQAVVSSGAPGSGSNQLMFAIAAVVVILVAVQMFQQFSGYMSEAFNAVDGDRFAVFAAPVGSLGETVAEFWGVLAFAGIINIAAILWRNYSGSITLGGSQGGL